MIYQWHPAFPAAYTGINSLSPNGEHATSRVLTLYTGLRLDRATELLFDLESVGGGGISQALGLAGFTNLDVVRNPTLGAGPYVARAMVHHTVRLGRVDIGATPGPLALASSVPERRLELRAGKLSLADFFDVNAVGSDSHVQFMNWTVDNQGAYDYAADTRGYTWGALVEFQDRTWGVRFAEALMPTVANGIALDRNLRRAHADNLELEVRRSLVPRREGAARLLVYVNHADMGSYREAIDAFLAGVDSVPDIVAHRQQGRVKAGIGLNVEQAITERLRVFGRLGANDGRNESFAYTEVDRSFEVGADLEGHLWRRDRDKVGIAFVSNGLSDDHRRYLSLGGRGFLLGDGRLTYGRERILEAYYTLSLWRGVSGAVDLQHITNPGYNRARGPVPVLALRMHVDL